MYVFVSRKIKNFRICGSCRSAINFANPQIAKNIGSTNRKFANCPTCGRSANVTNFVSPQICRFSEAWGKMIHEKNLQRKILWHCPFKAKHQRTQECTDVTTHNRNNSIYKITTPFSGVKEEICRRMPRNFFSPTQFQGKSLVFFQSINFLWPRHWKKGHSTRPRYLEDVPLSNGNASETKANVSFDNGVFFNIEAKRTPSIVSKLFSKRSEHIR